MTGSGGHTSTCGGERGAAAGFEVLPFGLLVFVIGSLIVANAWGVVDATFAASAAAREAARAYVEAGSESEALAEARAAAEAAIVGHGRRPERMSLRPVGEVAFRRCTRVTFEVSYRVPAVAVPWVGGFGAGITARSRHSEIVDPYRHGVPANEGSRCG